MDLFATYEYTVSPSGHGRAVMKKVLFIFGYILFAAILVSVILIWLKAAIPLISVVPVILWLLIWLTWRYACLEYEYSFTSGIMTVSHIYGNKTRKTIQEITIKDMAVIKPLAEARDDIRSFGPETVLDKTSSQDAKNVYVALYKDKHEKKTELLFDASEQTLKILKFYNPVTVVRPVV